MIRIGFWAPLYNYDKEPPQNTYSRSFLMPPTLVEPNIGLRIHGFKSEKSAISKSLRANTSGFPWESKILVIQASSVWLQGCKLSPELQ